MMGQILIALIALLHVYILVLEMFLWDKPYGLKAFGNTPESEKENLENLIKAIQEVRNNLINQSK